METFKSLDRMPCASVLVRILEAPLSDDGLKALTLLTINKFIYYC